MTDNGGEFSSHEIREITSILNIQLYTKAGESPFQNGLCERVHAITDMVPVKLEAEYGKTHSQTLLSWANMARKSLQMWNGYSSHQLVFGENPNLPNSSAVDNFLWMVYSTHHVSEIWCIQKLEGVPV